MWGRRLSGERTWIEIDALALRANIQIFRKMIGSKPRLWAVVKSNAYGHGLTLFSKLADGYGVDGFCVDSLVEGERLRREGIKKPMLVLGATAPQRFSGAAESEITLSLATFEDLKAVKFSKARPDFHLKIDTGMHRRGFYPEEIEKAAKFIKTNKLLPYLKGVFTHFAAAKDLNYPTYTDNQMLEFERTLTVLKKFGARNLTRHAAATGGTLMSKRYHLDAVRVGIGLYGLWPSIELEMQLPKVELSPVLSWYTFVSQVKKLKPGDFVGYDLTERVTRHTVMAVLPIGYWHGFSRSLSGIGQVLIRGRRARVLGRVSMDLLVVDTTGIPAKVGDTATLIGRNGRESLAAGDVARAAGTTHYEFVTRLNPLMLRNVKKK